jgi:hypothetical protein
MQKEWMLSVLIPKYNNYSSDAFANQLDLMLIN